MKFVCCVTLFALLFVCVAAKIGQNVNLAVETVINFDEKTASHDYQSINHLENFFQNIQTAVKKRGASRRSLIEELDLKNFIKNLAGFLLTYNDRNLEKWFLILDSEIRRYDYQGCQLNELLKIPEINNHITDKLEQIKNTPTKFKREKLKHLGLNLKDNRLMNYLNNLYRADTQCLTNFLMDLEQNKMSSRGSEADLKMIINNGIKTILCDRYFSLNDKTRQALREHLEFYFDKPEATYEKLNKTQSKKIQTRARAKRMRIVDQAREAEKVKSDEGLGFYRVSTDLTEELVTAPETSRSPRKLKRMKSESKKAMLPFPIESLIIESFELKDPTPVNRQYQREKVLYDLEAPTKHITHYKIKSGSDTKGTTSNTINKSQLARKGVKLRKGKKKEKYEIDNSELKTKSSTIDSESFERNFIKRFRDMKRKESKSVLIKMVQRLEAEVKQVKERLNEVTHHVEKYSGARKFLNTLLTAYTETTEEVANGTNVSKQQKNNTINTTAVN